MQLLSLSNEQAYLLNDALELYIQNQENTICTKEPTTLDWYDNIKYNIKVARRLQRRLTERNNTNEI